MSIDIDWTTLTAGPDGQALAESIRAFIHDRFQTIELPRMIRSVNVHAFDLGSIPPDVQIEDVLDPLPLFYQDSDDDEDDDQDEAGLGLAPTPLNEAVPERRFSHAPAPTASRDRTRTSRRSASLSGPPPSLRVDTSSASIHPSDRARSAFPNQHPHALPAQTPGLGVSGMSYFHLPLPLPLSAGLSGTSTPLAAVAAGGMAGARALSPERNNGQAAFRADGFGSAAPDLGLGTLDESRVPSHAFSRPDGVPDAALGSEPGRSHEQRNPLDTQIRARVAYKGDLKLSLTAELLLDYPTPAFVNIPLKVNVTGLEFAGAALVAYTHSPGRRGVHFCFMDDADDTDPGPGSDEFRFGDSRRGGTLTGQQGRKQELLREIQIESEIGMGRGSQQQGTGAAGGTQTGAHGHGQVLKNVDKVEKFILGQVRRIFGDEFVYPNYWTFLV